MAPQLIPATSLTQNDNGLKLHSKSHLKQSFRRLLRKALLALALASLIYILVAKNYVAKCQSPKPLKSCPAPSEKKRRRKLWKKEERIEKEIESTEDEEVSVFCRAARNTFEYFPWLPDIERQETATDEVCQSFAEEKPKHGPIRRLLAKLKRKKKKFVSEETDAHYHKAFTTEMKITPAQKQLIATLSDRVLSEASEKRLEHVAWGGHGGPYWWWPNRAHTNQPGGYGVAGGNLLASYLRIMRWPEDMIIHFPFKLCHEGCSAEKAIFHTLEWREKYKPWLMTPSAMKENEDGFVYTRGHSQSLSGDNSGHSMVWYRVGMHKVVDPEAYFRAILNTLDHSIADNLKRSHNKVGKYNVVMDGNHFRFSMMPNLNDVKRGLLMMQDHFPDRLGMVFIANLSRPGEILFNLITPFISKEVRDKIKLLPHDVEKRQAVLEAVVEKESIPHWLGGSDSYEFDVNTYYPSRVHWTEKEGREYLQTMPYHA